MITQEETTSLTAIVGSRYISTDPCIMDTYSFYINIDPETQEISEYTPRPVAVILPETTEEIREIVRFCNTSGLMVKPLSTGFGPWAAASRDRAY